jgi:chromatin remodeling complex protein RSC6
MAPKAKTAAPVASAASAATPAPAPAPEPVPEVVSEDTAPAPVVPKDQVKNPFTELIKSKEADIKRNREELASLKDEEKWFRKEFAELSKLRKKKADKAAANADKPVKKPSGFAMECELSEELSTFLGLAKGTSLTRPAVHKLVTNYIKEHKLEDEKSRKIIHPDGALGKILGVTDKPDDVVTYLNLQHYLKHHFVKLTKDTAKTQTQ